jgi:hypothetical protein
MFRTVAVPCKTSGNTKYQIDRTKNTDKVWNTVSTSSNKRKRDIKEINTSSNALPSQVNLQISKSTVRFTVHGYSLQTEK